MGWDGEMMLLNFLCKLFMEEKIMEQNSQIQVGFTQSFSDLNRIIRNVMP